MITIKNEDKYKNDEIVNRLLQLFKVAHKEQNGLSMAIVIRKLKMNGVDIEIDDIGDDATSRLEIEAKLQPQSDNEIRCPLMDT